jgi:hypothetical protein
VVIRTRDCKATIEIEITGSTVTAIDPITNEAQVISTKADWTEVNKVIWWHANQVRATLRNDLAFSQTKGLDLLARLYVGGQTALSRLIAEKEDTRPRLESTRNFFRSRIRGFCEVEAQPPIIDVKSTGGQYPIEFLPLLGRADVYDNPGTDWRHVARTLPAFSAVIRHVRLDRSTRSDDPQTLRPVRLGGLGVSMFLHHDLPGAVEELHFILKLMNGGKLNVTTVYPARGHSQRSWMPEKELADVMWRADTARVDDASDQLIHACHFTCHLRPPEHDSESAYLEMRPPWRPPFFRSERYELNNLEAVATDATAKRARVDVVFLDTCKSMIPDQATLTNAIKVFEHFHPDCLVGTVADVPDLTAAAFCSAFYEEFAGGTAMGAAIRIARLKLMDKPSYNPFGLLYCSYSGEDLHVGARQDRRARYVPAETDAVVESDPVCYR